jgi:hypothetical protein
MKLRVVVAAACLAVSLVASLGAGSAFAEKPAWYECAKVKGGPFEKGCEKEGGTGGWVVRPGIGKGNTFKGTGGEMSWHLVIPGKGDIKTTCASWKIAGGVAAPNKVTKVAFELKKCKVLGAPCKTEGGPIETIESESLAGELGYMNKSHSAAGLSLYNEAAPGSGLMATFECETFAKERWSGAIIASITPFLVMGKEKTLNYSVGAFLGEPKPGYTPLTNPPAFEEGAEPVGTQLTELNGPETGNEWAPEGGLPSGWEASASINGERLEIQ